MSDEMPWYGVLFVALLFTLATVGVVTMLQDCRTGGAGGPCYPNGTCDDGLTCWSGPDTPRRCDVRVAPVTRKDGGP